MPSVAGFLVLRGLDCTFGVIVRLKNELRADQMADGFE